jgi:hypothetical protein
MNLAVQSWLGVVVISGVLWYAYQVRVGVTCVVVKSRL